MMRLVVGCMTGTSIDGLDAALVEIDGTGLSMEARFVQGASRGLGNVAGGLRRLAGQEPMTAGEIADLAREFSLLHADVVGKLVMETGVDLVCVHGQTVYHAPPLSWQLFNPAPLVRACGVPVVFDLRAADVAAGGQGAPMTPLADWVLFRDRSARGCERAVVNLGGFVNITLLPRGDAPAGGGSVAAPASEVARIEGFDVCACNQLLDAVSRESFGEPFDEDGRRAAAGRVHAAALEDLVEILRAQCRGGRSLGTGDEGRSWLARWGATVRGEDLGATACSGIARVVAGRIGGRRVVIGGGGIRNQALRAALESQCDGGVTATDELGVPAAYREAACFAVLGALCQDGVPIALPQVTGAGREVPGGAQRGILSGCWMYP